MNPVAPHVLRSEREKDSPHLRTGFPPLLGAKRLPTPHSHKLNLKDLGKGGGDLGAYLLNFNIGDKLSETPNWLITNATGDNIFKATQVGTNIEGKAVHSDPAADFDANSGDFVPF